MTHNRCLDDDSVGGCPKGEEEREQSVCVFESVRTDERTTQVRVKKTDERMFRTYWPRVPFSVFHHPSSPLCALHCATATARQSP